MQRHYPIDPATGVENPALAWTNGVPASGIEGSYPPYQLVTDPQDELLNLIGAAGQTPSDGDLFQTLRAVRGGKLSTFVDTGTANHMVVTAGGTAHTSISKGLPLRIWPLFTNTTTSVGLKVDALAEAPVVKRDGTALAVGDIQLGVPVDVVADGAGNFRVVSLVASDIVAAVSGAQIGIQNVVTYATAGTFTYTPSAGTRAVLVEVIGACGGAGGSGVPGTGNISIGIGGGGGAYAKKYFLASAFASATVVVGTGGTAGAAGTTSAGGTYGGNGGTSSFTPNTGGAVTATGGSGGTAPGAFTSFPTTTTTASGGSASGGDINLYGGPSQSALLLASGQGLVGPAGCAFGGQSPLQYAVNQAGSAGTGRRSGGTGGLTYDGNIGQPGGAGDHGYVIITEIK